MSERYNPYYSPEKFGLTTNCFDQSNMCYEYNTMCFFVTPDGRIYVASDSGCSCPTPFDNYRADSLESCVQAMERIGSPNQAMEILRSWNEGHNTYTQNDIAHLGEWVNENLRKA